MVPVNFITADHHLFHEGIIEMCSRPFSGVEEMHKVIVNKHNSVVKKEDHVWFIGDLTLCSKQEVSKVARIFARLNGIKHLVIGNHDEWEFRTYLHIGFTTIHTAMWFKHGKYDFYMMHDPAEYAVIEKNKNAVLLCAHIHNLFPHLLPTKRVINMGVDIWDFSPVSIDSVISLLEKHNI